MGGEKDTDESGHRAVRNRGSEADKDVGTVGTIGVVGRVRDGDLVRRDDGESFEGERMFRVGDGANEVYGRVSQRLLVLTNTHPATHTHIRTKKTDQISPVRRSSLRPPLTMSHSRRYSSPSRSSNPPSLPCRNRTHPLPLPPAALGARTDVSDGLSAAMGTTRMMGPCCC